MKHQLSRVILSTFFNFIKKNVGKIFFFIRLETLENKNVSSLLYKLEDLGITFRQLVLHQITQCYPVTFPSPVAGFFIAYDLDRCKRTDLVLCANTRII